MILALAAASAPARDVVLIATADTEGHVAACQTCPLHVGFGGLARRATLLTNLRQADSDLLLLDAGNAFFGAESLDSGGKAIVAAYGAMNYAAVNISYRDFRLGRSQTAELLRSAPFACISANLQDANTGALLFPPFVIKEVAGKKVAVLGVTDIPAGRNTLPRLKQQLEGVTIQPPLDALAQWLPKAKAESDRVILLYYGAAPALRGIQAKHAGDLAAILVGGLRPEQLPENGNPPFIGADEHGKSMARVEISESKVNATQIAIDPATLPDPAMEKLLGTYEVKPFALEASSVAAPNSGAASGKPAPVMTAPPVPSNSPPPPPTTAPTVATTLPAASEPSPRVAARSNLTARGLEGVGLTADQVNRAIDSGAMFLWNYIKTEDLEKKNQKLGDSPEHVLACLALVHAGAHKKFPDFDRQLRGFITRFHPDSNLTVYQYGLMSMLIEAYGDPTFFARQEDAARYLVEAEGPGGTWTYMASIPAGGEQNSSGGPLAVLDGSTAGAGGRDEGGMSRRNDWSVGVDGDSSCSQFAVLGLHSAARCHLKIATEVWKRNLAACRRRQGASGGWGYGDSDANSAYGSMTCAGICATTIDRYEMGEAHPEIDPGIERGIAWLDGNFSVEANPGRSSYLYYYLYSLERVGRVLDTEFIGTHEWYPLGARFLVDHQVDGKWIELGDVDPRNSTSFALLFLTRATPKLSVEARHGGPGTLRADVRSPPPARLYIILDASGSMIDVMEGKQKFDVARGAVQNLIDAMPDSAQVALRVYGHRKQSIEPGSDEDTALEIPMGMLDRAAFAAKLKSLRPRGKTPLALSLTNSINDLGDASPANPVTLVLLTDGGEDTMPRRNPVKAADALAASRGIFFHIVGFDINQPEWGTQLRAMADHGRGFYWPAEKPDALSAQLQAAVFGRPKEFTVTDATGREIHRGAFGESLSLPEGKYTFATTFNGVDFHSDFSISTDSTTAVLFDTSRIPKAIAGASSAETAKPAAGTTAKFCTHCGHALPPGAKFCPGCGSPVPH